MPRFKASAKGATPSRETVLEGNGTLVPSALRNLEESDTVVSPMESSRGSRTSRRKTAINVTYNETDGSEQSSGEDTNDRYVEAGHKENGSEEDRGSKESGLSDEDFDSEDLDTAPSDRRNVKGKIAGFKRKAESSGTKRKDKKQKTEVENKGTIDYSDYEEDSDSDESLELKPGQTLAGKIVSAPKTGHVPPGQISRNTLKFLVNLQVPERNDRDWFKVISTAIRQIYLC
jgi:hypothetical protein